MERMTWRAPDKVWAQVREQLARAGLLQTSTRRIQRPPPEAVANARAAAGHGQPLSEIVREQRG